MIDLIRQIIDANGLLPVAARTLAPNANLYEAGLSPFAAIQLMLALEEACGVEFPRQMLRRQSFSSLECTGCTSRPAPAGICRCDDEATNAERSG